MLVLAMLPAMLLRHAERLKAGYILDMNPRRIYMRPIFLRKKSLYCHAADALYWMHYLG
jgi:hypothetical protein